MNKFIIAFDDMDKKEVFNFLEEYPQINYVKIAPDLFYKYGKIFIEELFSKYNKKIFLDLKLHDIPNTVSNAISALKGLPLEFLTIHISGGKEMLSAAITTAKKCLPHTTLVGISLLTSLEQKEIQSMLGPKKQIMEQMALIAKEVGIKALVCPASDLNLIQSLDLIKICPGIRFQDDSNNDQRNVSTPLDAINMGADFLVIGRSLTQSKQTKKRISTLLNY